MNVALRKPMTVEQFLDWAEAQDERYEFDGVRPVAMTGGNANHTAIMMNIHAALRMRLRGSPCKCFGPDLAMRTVGEKIRFPDALVTCTRFPGTDRIAPNPVVVFEVLTPTSGPMDRVTKVEEYRAVPSIRRYVIVESAVRRVLVLNRAPGVESWTEMPLAADETLDLPEIGCGIQVEELYENVLFAEAASTP